MFCQNGIQWKPENRGTIRKTTDMEDGRIVRYSKVNRFESFKDIKSELNLGIGDNTIWKRPRKVPLY